MWEMLLLTRGLEVAPKGSICFLCRTDLRDFAEGRHLSSQSQGATEPEFLLQQAENRK